MAVPVHPGPEPARPPAPRSAWPCSLSYRQLNCCQLNYRQSNYRQSNYRQLNCCQSNYCKYCSNWLRRTATTPVPVNVKIWGDCPSCG